MGSQTLIICHQELYSNSRVSSSYLKYRGLVTMSKVTLRIAIFREMAIVTSFWGTLASNALERFRWLL